MKGKLLKIIILFLLFSLALANFHKDISAETGTTISITKLSEFSTGGRAFDVIVREDIAFVADLSTGLNIINISNPYSPQLIALYEMDHAHKIFLDDNIAYVTGWEFGFEIINITDLENPMQLSHFNGINMNTLYIENDCAFIDSEGLQILNISDPTNPKEIYHYYDSGNISAVFIRENIAYLGTYVYGSFQGFTIVDVTNKTNPLILGHHETTHYVAGIRVEGDLALAAIWDSGLVIFNISNPISPTIVSSFFDGGAAEIAYFVNGYAFVADYNNGLEILNIKDPENPIEIGQFFDGGGAYGIALKGNHAFIADDFDGLEILEITGLFPATEINGFTAFVILIPISFLLLFRKKK